MASPGEAAPTIVLTRQTLLSLYSSPLVPQTLDGMKPLSEWYGEYTTPPSPPIQRSHLPRGNSSNQIQQSTTERGDRGDRDRGAGRRLAPFTSENPFANFGRFGVDGGLGEPLELPRRSRKGGELTGGASGGGGEKDLAPHLQQLIGGGGGGKKGKDNEGGGTSPWSDGTTRDARERRENFFREERERSERSKNATAVRGGALAGNGNGRSEIEGDRRRGAAGLNGRETGDASERKDRRGLGPADEGGWRSVGTTREEREKRLLRNQSTSTGNALTDSPRRFDRGDRNDRDPHSRSSRDDRGDRRGGGGGGGPAWMNDEESSSPSWMDAPAAGNLTFSKDGVAIPEGQGGDDDELEAPAKKSSNLDWTAGGNSGMMDSIQQWKQQMKEAERKERERDLRDAGIEPQPQPEPQPQEEESSSVFSALTSPKPEPASTKSIFEDLGIVRSPAVTPAAPPGLDIPRQQGQGGKGGEPGGRASRFAKFFDGKPQSPVTQAQQPPPSVFGALMGGNAQGNQNGNGPSKEDSDSMARLMGMLQVQGSRTGSPATHAPHVETASPIVASPASVAAPPPAPSAPASTTTAQLPAAAEESRSSSRFKFSNSTSKNSPSISSAPSGALSSQVSSAVQSPSAPSAPPTSSIPPPGFGGYSSSQPQPQPHQQPSHPHSQTSLNHLPPIMSPADQLRSPPLPLPQSQQQQQHQNLHHPRTISSTSDLASRSSTLGSSATSPPPPSQNYSMNNPQQQLHQNRPFPPQFYNNGPPLPPSNGQQRMPPPPGSIPGMNLPPLGMYPPGSQGLSPAHSQLPLPGQPHQGMMNPADMLRNLPPPNPNGMRSPPPPSFPPPHGMGGMLPPHARGPQQPSQMMYPPPPTGPLPPHGYAPPHFQQQGGRPQGMQGMSLGGNAGVDLMALLNSGQGGMRIGGNQGPPPPNHGPQQGNLPPFLMDGR